MPRISTQFLREMNVRFAPIAANHAWISECLHGENPQFPYFIPETGTAKIDNIRFCPRQAFERQPDAPRTNNHPRHLINIPVYFGGKPPNVAGIIRMVTEEGFAPQADSQEQAVGRVAVVIGINRPCSLSPEKNRTMKSWIGNLQEVEGVAHRIFGFFWQPEYEAWNRINHLYPPKKAFRVLYYLNKERAETVRKSVEGAQGMSPGLRKQIPYQEIREAVLNHSHTRDFAKFFEREAPGALSYLVTMDGDAVSLRGGGEGVLALADREALRSTPSAMSFGYRLPEDEIPILRLAVKLDMMVRKAVTGIIPWGAYLPEPGTFFCFRRPPHASQLRRLSFLGRGKGMEARRMAQNGIRTGIFDNRVHFGEEGAIITTTPDRMYTEKNRKIGRLGPNNIKQKKVLSALRAVSQSHLFPKNWADNIYPFLGFNHNQVTHVTTPMMRIFGVYDPISRMYAKGDNFSARYFNEVMAEYDGPLTAGQQQVLQAAKKQLREIKMPEAIIGRVEEAAIASGRKIRDGLQDASSNRNSDT